MRCRTTAVPVLRCGLVAFAALGAVLVTSIGVASAHVSIEPPAVPSGAAQVVITLRVPNEQPNANTVGLKVQLPTDHPILSVKALPVPGWATQVDTKKLTSPVTTDDGTISEVVSEIEWSGGKIGPNEFGEFKVLAEGLPTDTDRLVLKTVQVYDNNAPESAWIEVADAANPNPEHPAPVLLLTPGAASAPGATTVPTTGAGTTGTTRATPKVAVDDGDDDKATPKTSTPSSELAEDELDAINSNDATKSQFYLAMAVGGFAVVLSAVAIFVSRAKPK